MAVVNVHDGPVSRGDRVLYYCTILNRSTCNVLITRVLRVVFIKAMSILLMLCSNCIAVRLLYYCSIVTISSINNCFIAIKQLL
jgi:hypothetical protein